MSFSHLYFHNSPKLDTLVHHESMCRTYSTLGAVGTAAGVVVAIGFALTHRSRGEKLFGFTLQEIGVNAGLLFAAASFTVFGGLSAYHTFSFLYTSGFNWSTLAMLLGVWVS